MGHNLSRDEERFNREASSMVHDGDCVFDASLFEMAGDATDTEALKMTKNDAKAYGHIYLISPPQVLGNVSNAELIKVTNLVATVSMERNIDDAQIRQFRARAQIIQNRLLELEPGAPRPLELVLEIQDLSHDHNRLINDATKQYDILQRQFRSFRKMQTEENHKLARELAEEHRNHLASAAAVERADLAAALYKTPTKSEQTEAWVTGFAKGTTPKRSSTKSARKAPDASDVFNA